MQTKAFLFPCLLAMVIAETVPRGVPEADQAVFQCEEPPVSTLDHLEMVRSARPVPDSGLHEKRAAVPASNIANMIDNAIPAAVRDAMKNDPNAAKALADACAGESAPGWFAELMVDAKQFYATQQMPMVMTTSMAPGESSSLASSISSASSKASSLSSSAASQSSSLAATTTSTSSQASSSSLASKISSASSVASSLSSSASSHSTSLVSSTTMAPGQSSSMASSISSASSKASSLSASASSHSTSLAASTTSASSKASSSSLASKIRSASSHASSLSSSAASASSSLNGASPGVHAASLPDSRIFFGGSGIAAMACLILAIAL